MSDPRRLLDDTGSPEARLLASALDETPPPDLLARTLGAAGAAAIGAKASASSTPAGALAAAKAAGGGILGAAGIGALAGVLTVGAVELAGRGTAPLPVPAAASASYAPSASPALPRGAGAAPANSAEKPSGSPPRTDRPSPGSARPPLAAELALLDEARVTLHGGDPARAWALLDRYAREMPRGQMAREAALLRAEVDAARDGGASNP